MMSSEAPIVRPAVILVLAALVAGCGVGPTGPGDDGQAPEGVPVDASRVDWQTLEGASTAYSDIEERRRAVIRTEADWADFWEEMHGNVAPTPEPPSVDFDDRLVIAATMGLRRSGGYSIEVTDVFADDGTLYPVVRETSPGPGCTVTQALTAPATAVVVVASDVEIEFVEESRTRNCG